MSTINFACHIETQQKEDFRRLFKRRFLLVDFLYGFFLFLYWWLYKEEDRLLDGLIFIVTGCMFFLDGILLVWLISYKGAESVAPRWLLIINIMSNSSTLIPYIIGRVILILYMENAANMRLISWTLFGVGLLLKILKLYVLWKYKKCCANTGCYCCCPRRGVSDDLLDGLNLGDCDGDDEHTDIERENDGEI